LVRAHRESILGNRMPAYDGRKSLFTAGPLPFEVKEFKVKLGDNDEPGSSATPTSDWFFFFLIILCVIISYCLHVFKCKYIFKISLTNGQFCFWMHRKKREREFRVTIRFASKTDLHHLTQFLARRQLDCPQETIQALDVVLRATPSEKLFFYFVLFEFWFETFCVLFYWFVCFLKYRFDVVGRSFFSPALGPKGPLGNGTEYWRGYYQSLRPTQMGLSLNIGWFNFSMLVKLWVSWITQSLTTDYFCAADVSARAFYEPIPVLDFISKNFRLDLRRPLHDQDRVKVLFWKFVWFFVLIDLHFAHKCIAMIFFLLCS